MGRMPINILYVEDDADLRALVEFILEREPDMHALCCEPESELEILDRIRAFQPDLVLLDIMMPCIDGVSVARSMQADPLLAKVPFVFMTAKARPQELVELSKLGALGVISKPFDALQLPNELRTLLAKRA